MVRYAPKKGIGVKKCVNYYPFGLEHKGYNNVVSSNGNSVAQKRKFMGMEYQDELGLDWYDVNARNYDASLGKWFNIDPLAEDYYEWSPYNYSYNSPIVFIDPTGKGPESTHIDKDGNVIAVIDDGDKSVYQHGDNADGGTPTEYMIKKRQSIYKSTSANGKKVGETHTEFGFADFGKYEKGIITPAAGAKIDLNSNWAEEKVLMVNNEAKDLKDYAKKAQGGGDFDIKTKSPNGNTSFGSKLFGKYASARDAGNFAAGMMAERAFAVPNSIIDYGYGLYNNSGNSVGKSLKSAIGDILSISTSKNPINTANRILKTRANQEHPLTLDGINAGKNFIKNNK